MWGGARVSPSVRPSSLAANDGDRCKSLEFPFSVSSLFSCDNAGVNSEQDVFQGRQKATKERSDQPSLAHEIRADATVDAASPEPGGILHT